MMLRALPWILVGRSHAVECGGAAAAGIAELGNTRAGTEVAIGPLQRRQVGFAVSAEVAALALADHAVLWKY